MAKTGIKVTVEDKQKAHSLMTELLELRADVHECEKTLSRIRNETLEVYAKLDAILDAEIDGEENQR